MSEYPYYRGVVSPTLGVNQTQPEPFDPNVPPLPEDPVVELQEEEVEITPAEEPTSEETTASEAPPPTGRIPHNVLIEEVWTSPAEFNEDEDTIALPGNFEREVKEVLNTAPNIDYITGSPEAAKWGRDLAAGLQMLSYKETFVPNFEREGQHYGQFIDYNNVKLKARQPKLKTTENQILRGERATLRLVSHLGLGSTVQIPLWHSGFWITFKPPTESELVELDRLLSNDKIKFGRYTYGMIFSNTSVYINDRLIDFALSHIYDTTIKNEVTLEELKGLIVSQDIQTLLAGFACTMYPNGFQYSRSCVANPEKCNHVIQERLNLKNLILPHRGILTDSQKAHMSNWRPGSKDIESIKDYQAQLSRIQPKRIVFNKDKPSEFSMMLKSPTIIEYVEAGHRWISNIVDMVEDVLSKEKESRDRNALIIRHGQATAMRQYAHWVQSIEFASNAIEDTPTIESNLDILSADDYIRNTFLESVSDYINDSTFCIVGIPAYNCPNPKCGASVDSPIKLPYHTNIIPLDVVQVFTNLLTQRVERISTR